MLSNTHFTSIKVKPFKKGLFHTHGDNVSQDVVLVRADGTEEHVGEIVKEFRDYGCYRPGEAPADYRVSSYSVCLRECVPGAIEETFFVYRDPSGQVVDSSLTCREVHAKAKDYARSSLSWFLGGAA